MSNAEIFAKNCRDVASKVKSGINFGRTKAFDEGKPVCVMGHVLYGCGKKYNLLHGTVFQALEFIDLPDETAFDVIKASWIKEVIDVIESCNDRTFAERQTIDGPNVRGFIDANPYNRQELSNHLESLAAYIEAECG